MKKPTPAQRKVLGAMRDGALIEHWCGPKPEAKICYRASIRGVRITTFYALKLDGWIDVDPTATAKKVSLYRMYAITDAGRAALEETKL
jgi:hypothetical protein